MEHRADHHVFGSYEGSAQASAGVDQLIATGFPARDITVLLHDCPESRDFAALKGTRVPDGVDRGPKADLPLAGSYGLANPAAGPKEGALDIALNGMGVPLDWAHGVLRGRVLVSVECTDGGSVAAERVLEATGAADIGKSFGTHPKAAVEAEGHRRHARAG